MSTISRVTTWSDNQVLTAAALNAEFDNIVSDYNGSITNSNISASAAITYSKLTLTGSVLNADLAGSIAASKITNTAATLSDTQTLTNKTIIASTNVLTETTTVESSATPTPTGGSLRNALYVTALAAAAEFQEPSGTPANGNTLIIRVTDDGTARALTYDAIYQGIGVDLPSTTTASKTIYMGFIYNSTAVKWDCLAVSEEA
jgi:hypothetical protein